MRYYYILIRRKKMKQNKNANKKEDIEKLPHSCFYLKFTEI